MTLAGTLVLAAALVGVESQTAEAAPMLLYVNAAHGHDTGICSSPSAACATISYALSQAGAGATIKVSPGLYPEQLTITQSVTIAGRAPGVTIAPAVVVQNDVADDPFTNSPVPQFAIIDVHNASTPINVTLQSLTVNGAGAGANSFSSCSDNFPGVLYHNASGSLLSVHVNSVEMSPSLFGCQTGKGVGILVGTDAGYVSNVFMSKTNVSNYQKTGIECVDTGTTCSIANSKVTGIGETQLTSQNGVEVWGVSKLTFTQNRVSQNSYSGPNGAATGLFIINAGTVAVRSNNLNHNDVDVAALGNYASGPMAPAGTWTIAGNKLKTSTDQYYNGAAGHGYGDGLAIDSTTNTVVVKGNQTTSNPEYGIALYGATGVTLARNNGGNNNYDGIYVGGPGTTRTASTGNTISGNRARFDTNDGIVADVSAVESGNTFSSNSLHKNTNFEAQDLSTGGGTAATANTWSGNHCGTPHVESPMSIC